MNYQQTLDAFRDLVELGYSISEALSSLQDSDGDPAAINQIEHVQKYGT